LNGEVCLVLQREMINMSDFDGKFWNTQTVDGGKPESNVSCYNESTFCYKFYLF